MIKEIYKYQFPVFKIEAIITVFTIFVALVLANAIWETTVLCEKLKCKKTLNLCSWFLPFGYEMGPK